MQGKSGKGLWLYRNGRIHSMESEDACYGAMLLEDGRIRMLFKDEDALQNAAGEDFTGCSPELAKRLRSLPSSRIIELQGQHVFPALCDSHLHLLDSIALAAMSLHLCSVQQGRIQPSSLPGAEAAIRQYVAQNPKSPLIVVSDYISCCMEEGRLPNRHELDDWGGGRKIWVLNMDGHSSSCSSPFLAQLGLESVAPDGILLGPAHDANLGRITAALSSAITPRILSEGIAAFSRDCQRYGIATVCALEGRDDAPGRDILTQAAAFLAQRMPFDVALFPQYFDQRKLKPLLRRMERKRVGGCMKWELDGSVGSRTAAFREPYLDGSIGHLYFDKDELSAQIRGFHDQGFQISAHAIGECAISQLLDIYESLPRSETLPRTETLPCSVADNAAASAKSTTGLRHRIDHCEFPAPEELPRIEALKPFVSVQPGYAWFDKRYLHGYQRFLPQSKVEQQIPLRRLAQAGVPLLGSSDSPVQSIDPYLQMRGMREFYLPEESLSAYQALCSYTVNAGLALGRKIGMLSPGYEASFFSCDEDLLSISPEQLEGFQVNELWIRGARYRASKPGLLALLGLILKKAKKI